MFESFALRPLWKTLDGHLRDLVEKQPNKKLHKALHDNLSQAVDDLADVIGDTLAEGSLEGWFIDHIFLVSEPEKPALEIQTMPLNQLTQSQLLIFEMSERLIDYVSLEQVKKQVGYSEEEWESLLGHYSGHFVRHGARFALDRMIKNETLVAQDFIVLALSDTEEYVLTGEKESCDMIKFYALPAPNDNTNLSVKEARKIWLNRFKPNCRYEKNVVGQQVKNEEALSKVIEKEAEQVKEKTKDPDHTFEA